MRRFIARSLCLALFATLLGCATGRAQTDVRVEVGSPGSPVSISYFYDSLSPYGQWIQDPNFGWVWTPYDMLANWRPYQDGHWENTDYGWSWASNEPWGWATYHYGRWTFDDSYGWVWVPGTEWAPAWVAWRNGDDCVGWAPLPPTARWNDSAGLDFSGADAIPSYEWCFVPQRHFLDGNLRGQVVSVARNVTLFSRSRDATRIEVRGGRPADVGIDVALVERNVGRKVPQFRVADAAAPGRGDGRSAGKGTVGFFRPTVRSAPAGQAPAPSTAQRASVIPDKVLQSQRAAQQRKLESDLKDERTRLLRDQASELRAQGKGTAVDEIRQRQATEQQAFEAHATQQRNVLAQRMQKQVVKPMKVKKSR